MPKHVVVLYGINSIHISTIKNKVVLDKYIHSSLVLKFLLQLHGTLHSSSVNSITQDLSNGVVF